MSKDEINRLLAEKVMGWWTLESRPSDSWFADGGGNIMSEPRYWNPYDNIAQAMMVADEVIAMGYHFELKYNNYDGKFAWSAAFEESDTWGFQQINSTSACEAICRAALKVVEND